MNRPPFAGRMQRRAPRPPWIKETVRRQRHIEGGCAAQAASDPVSDVVLKMRKFLK